MDASMRDMATWAVLHPAGRPSHRSARRWRSAGLPAVAAAVLVLSALLPGHLLSQTLPPCATATALQPVGEIESKDGKLRAVITIESGKRYLPGKSEPQLLRYYSGHSGHDPAQPPRWPPKDWSCAGPGPTLRARIGDQVQIMFLNRVKTEDFGASLDSGERHKPGQGCDQTWTPGPNGRENFYPGNDKYPNCFHGSSSANIHFHGTHVTPATTGDNVLVNVRPGRKGHEETIKTAFRSVFQQCGLNEEPKKWQDLPATWRGLQKALLTQYDASAPFEGGRSLPRNLRLWTKDSSAIALGLWPQWYVGSYPYCFQLPKCPVDKPCGSNLQMGQAPGTHWYHSHKHGSTALNLFNGLSGAFIIADDSPEGYDGKLKAFYRRQGGLDEQVLVIQQLATVINLTTPGGGGPPPLVVNGQRTPTIAMQPGQVQLWRIINASVQGFVNIQFKRETGEGPNVVFKQTAQDGVQLAPENYGDPANGKQSITMAPANRVDLLVQAPREKGTYLVGSLLKILVANDPKPAGFPSQADFPRLPEFLADVDQPIHERRDITYGSRGVRNRTQLQFTIDDKQFEGHLVDQVMRVDTAEEWTVYNADALSNPSADGKRGQIAHPFHIHVNPFQVGEVFDPTKSMNKPKPGWKRAIWWDTFAIPPPAKMDPGQSDDSCPSKVFKVGNDRWCAGYFKMRTRFVDFTGQYVQHCHILAHEDRGMMQLLQVVPKETALEHH